MLRIKKIRKEYKTGDLTQIALNEVSLSFRDNEFVSILGPSGSGKTTLLNVVGGLDSYDSGDLIINGISTKKYGNREWDTYRNHSIGFIFQSYNLIQHQSVLSNVELALTIGGVSKTERKKRATEALAQVGLGEHTHKRPNQLSGGQMQRVAIARALVNNPDILLADEPTGALDTETSIQIMELLKKVAKDKLVIMVTHNPELAEEYSSRIVRLKDGEISGDSNPFEPQEEQVRSKVEGRKKVAKMSIMTALSLSFNNLKTKKRRTLLTSFAGSIGIIGIALILSLSSGVNTYIDDLQSDTMSSYPITIEAESIDLEEMMGMAMSGQVTEINDRTDIHSDYSQLEAVSSMTVSNNLTEFKTYLDDPKNSFANYVGENGIKYSYDTKFSAYSYNKDGELVNTNSEASVLLQDPAEVQSQAMAGGSAGGPPVDPMMSMMSGRGSSAATNFEEMLTGTQEDLINDGVKASYELLDGTWPNAYDEVIVFLDENNELPVEVLYQMGLMTSDEYKQLAGEIEVDKEITEYVWEYEDILNREYYIQLTSDMYESNEDGTFVALNEEYFDVHPEKIEEGTVVKVVGIAKKTEGATENLISTAIGYTSALTDYIIEESNNSEIVLAQERNPTINVLTGEVFDLENDEVNVDTNLALFGKINYDTPSAISIYADSFEDKDAIVAEIEGYNETVAEENQILYTDLVETMTESMTTMIDVISYVLIAFVGVSLVVSCIMIGIITHISVMERTKEIGVLRALGASKGNISQVFNAETMIIGLCSGLLGVGIASLLNMPITALIQELLDNTDITTVLPVSSSITLILLSVIITVIGGFVPAKSAAKKDPVIALRTE